MIQIEHLSKSFKTADGTVEALKDITLTVPDGEIFGIIGMSGAGKSTLVRCINMLERPTEGRVIIDGCDISALPAKQLREMRRSITMIFQGFNLLMQRNCLKNVCFPMELAGIPAREAEARAKELLELVADGNKKLQDAEQNKVDLKLLMKALRDYTDIRQLTPEIVNALIRRIEVHSKDKKTKKVKVDIYFTAVGLFTPPTEQALQMAMEEIRRNPQQFGISA